MTSEFGKHVTKVLDVVNAKDTNNVVDGKRIPHVPLYLGLTMDDTQTNRTGGETCPLLIEQKNFPNEPYMLGLQPVCPLSKATLRNIQTKMGCLHKGVQNEQITALHKLIRHTYVEDVIKEVRAHHKNGVLLQIGNKAGNLVIAHPMICLHTADGKEHYSQCSISWQMSGCKCRFCIEENCLRFTKDVNEWKPRDDVRMKILSTELDRIQKKIHRKLCEDTNAQTRKKEWYTQHELQIIAEAKSFNILPSCCTVYHDLGSDVSKIWGIPNFGLHCMGAIDMLHTFLKGIVENSICWSMSCLYLLQDINPDKYRDIVSNLDAIFHTFPYRQSVTPVPLHYKEYGISKLITDARSKKQSAISGTGTGVGGTPASQLPGIALMLLYAIGKEGGAAPAQSRSRIPEEIELPSNRVNNDRYRPSKEYKVRTILVNALQSVLNALTFARKNDGFSKENLAELDYLLKLARGHLLQLFSLKSDLKQMRSGISVNSRVYPKFSGIKHHLLEHLTFCIRLYGTPDNFDTQSSEHYHVLIKRFYRATSRRKDSSDDEILKHFSRVRRLSFLQRAYPSSSVLELLQETPTQLPLLKLKEKHERRIKELKVLNDVIEKIKTAMFHQYEKRKKEVHLEEVTAASQRQEMTRLQGQQNPIMMETHILRIINLNKLLELRDDSLFGTFFFPKSTIKTSIEVNQSSYSRNDPLPAQSMGTFFECQKGKDLLHPFVDWRQLYTYMNLKTPEGWSKEFFQRHKLRPDLYKIKLNEMLSSSGKPELGIEPFTIHCNVKTNNFSSIELSYQDDEQHVVRVFGIVSLHQMRSDDPRKEKKVRIVLICGRLKKIETTARKRVDSIHCQILKYDILSGTNSLEVDVIDLTSIIRPACLIPVFTSTFRPKFQEKSTDLLSDRRIATSRYYGHRHFYHVPIPTMRYFKVINFQVIDAAIDMTTACDLMAVEEETQRERKEREARESNYIAHHLFLSEQELKWTERTNLAMEMNVQNSKSYRDDMWKEIESGEMWREADVDEYDDDDILLN